jgi:RNA polymerase sigma-70 factor (ECF subfamily)
MATIPNSVTPAAAPTARTVRRGESERRRQRALFERLMLPQRAALTRFAFQFTRDRDDAEDLAQETLLRAFEKLDTFRTTGAEAGEGEAAAVRAWLFAILRNLFFTAYRCRMREPRLAPLGDGGGSTGFASGVGSGGARHAVRGGVVDPEELGDPAGAGAGRDPASQAVTRAQCQAVLASIGGLPDVWRVPVEMVDLEGCSYQEVADTLGVPLNTIRTRIFRGRRMVQRRLALWQMSTPEDPQGQAPAPRNKRHSVKGFNQQ